MVERTFPDRLDIPPNDKGIEIVGGVVANNLDEQVTWVHSFVSDDKRKTFCIYDGPTPESIRRAATANGLPVDLITQVNVLDPYFYVGGEA
jgi:hypothetical protein